MSMSYRTFSIRNPSCSERQLSHFKLGIPCKKGKWAATDSFLAHTNRNPLENTYAEIKQLWDDGSVKWLSMSGVVKLLPDEKLDIKVTPTPSQSETFTFPVLENSQFLDVALNNGTFMSINRDELCSYTSKGTFTTELRIENTKLIFEGRCKTNYRVLRHGNVYSAVVVTQSACLLLSQHRLNVTTESTIYLHDGSITTDISFTNPAPANHPNGQWDLGDPNALLIQEISLVVRGEITHFSTEGTRTLQPLKSGEEIEIYQAASGNLNWQSPVHVNANGEVPFPFNGYKVTSNETVLDKGQHSTPVVWVGNAPHSYSVMVDKFWQHFPSSTSLNAKEAKISLLGAQQASAQELQPGEQITRTFAMSTTPLSKAIVEVDPNWVIDSQVVPFAPFQTNSELASLIKEGISGDNSFYQKRLKLDEFGWRHFGELYADHEYSLSQDTEYFVSHYNNQYDPIQGMLYQWLTTGDHRWFELADDLAKHVADIDVYHTMQDKPEYSGGLFWHTDHYVQACTATHRTYSKHQPSNVYDDHAGGGGPGGQHCYTNGLLLHYQLTGSQSSKQALISICHWISQYYEGDGSVFGTLLSIKNAGTPELKNIKTGKYPLDRGTGNYLQALMDRFELIGKLSDLAQCGYIIKHTVSPKDDIAARELTNVEATWFYTVFLQAVCRFIQMKESRNECDEDYIYAVCSLTHYAQWMATNEYAYLDKPSVLEFPNQTWSGQDLRKLCVLEFAKSYLSKEWVDKTTQKTTTIKEAITSRLKDNREASTTRVLCLLMQNANFLAYSEVPSPLEITPKQEKIVEGQYSMGKAIWRNVKHVSIKYEVEQLKKRFPKFQNVLGKL